MKKSITTRFKVTGAGKVMHRKKGQCHFKINKSSKQLGRKLGEFPAAKAIRSHMRREPNKF